MRDYLYLWHNPKRRMLVASGIELKDLAPLASSGGGLLLLRHGYTDATHDPSSRFDHVAASDIKALIDENVYSWGDFCWADYTGDSFPALTKQEVAELLYFGHTGELLEERIGLPSLGNRFLARGHDDGWFLNLYYDSWSDMIHLLDQLELLKGVNGRSALLSGEHGAFWIDHSGLVEEEATFDIDSLLNRRYQKSKAQQDAPSNGG